MDKFVAKIENEIDIIENKYKNLKSVLVRKTYFRN
jgi:hypothetical protein